MSKQQSLAGGHMAPVSSGDVRRIFGEVGDAKTIEILALRPGLRELEEAAVWAAGDGDVLAKSGRPLSRVAAAIVDILAAEDEEFPQGL